MQSLSEIAHSRLHPPLTEPSYLVLRSRRKIFTAWINELGDRPLKVLDVGGRYQPYRPLLGKRVVNYIAVDIIKTELVTVIADGQTLPFAPESFDLVIATQVLEFFPKPYLAAEQMYSALRPGGVLLASVAEFAPRFNDAERWRFTPLGIRTILAPFEKVEIAPEVYSIGGVLRALNVAGNTFARYDTARAAYRCTLCPLLNLLGLALEKLSLTSSDAFTGNYSVRATKG
jgi:SAM-dependent methyltransferase